MGHEAEQGGGGVLLRVCRGGGPQRVLQRGRQQLHRQGRGDGADAGPGGGGRHTAWPSVRAGPNRGGRPPAGPPGSPIRVASVSEMGRSQPALSAAEEQPAASELDTPRHGALLVQGAVGEAVAGRRDGGAVVAAQALVCG